MHIHILGICGTFMGGLAALAREAGHTVTGCDDHVYPPMSQQLEALGIDLISGYQVEQLKLKPDIFIIGNVISRPSPSSDQARFPLMEAILENGLPYTSGPQWLSQHVLQGRHVLAVAGTHGKTTTASLLAWILEYCGHAPGFLIGGVPENFGISARLGAQDKHYFVIEADEYDTAFFDKRSKFVHYQPRTLIINNLEFDHADIFKDLAAIELQFAHLLRTLPAKAGRIIANAPNEAIERVLARGCWSTVERFGQANALWSPQGPAHDFKVQYQDQTVGNVQWNTLGQHNQLNALAAIAAAAHVNIDPAHACEALAHFTHVKRRMELKYQIKKGNASIDIYDDFAHHPTAIATTLEGLYTHLRHQQGDRPRRLIAVFEPRSNTMKLGTMKDQLASSLQHADLAICHTGGLDWDVAQALAPMGNRAQCATSIDDTLACCLSVIQPGDCVLIMSNGGFGGIAQKLAHALSSK